MRIEQLEYRLTLSAGDITTLASFSDATGFGPGPLSMDGSGNIFGTLESGGADNRGAVFKVGGATLAFNDTDGEEPDGIVVDGAGNLFGAAYFGGGEADGGFIFELIGGTFETLFTFNGDDGSQPNGLVMASNGNIYGTTAGGGSSGDGTVFQFFPGSNTIHTLYSFSGADGAHPYTPPTVDNSGNLYGTTNVGGADNLGTVFEVSSGGGLVMSASFNGKNGQAPGTKVAVDSSGNIYGATPSSAAPGGPTIFEVEQGTNSICTLASFSGTGDFSPTNVVLDSSGNLYGATGGGGVFGDGSTYELAKGTKSIIPLASFNGTDGSDPTQVILDAQGILYGTTAGGGAYGSGTLFQVPVTGGPALTSSSPTSAANSSVSFTAQMPTGAFGTPTGSVTFMDDTTAIGTVPLSPTGVARLTEVLGPANTSHNISAVYSGDTNYPKSTSNSLTQTVTAATPTGSWTSLTIPSTGPVKGTSALTLLSDGTVMAQDGNKGFASADWYRLEPDSSGNYVNGKWTTLSSMSTGRLFFPSNVLQNGDVLVAGGEYSDISGSLSSLIGTTTEPITVTTASPLPPTLLTNDYVDISGVTGFASATNPNFDVNGTWQITVTGSNTFTLNTTAGNPGSANATTGRFSMSNSLSSVVGTATGPITVTTTSPLPQNLLTNGYVDISGVTGFVSVNGTWPITRTGSNTFTLDNSIGIVGSATPNIGQFNIHELNTAEIFTPPTSPTGQGSWQTIASVPDSANNFGDVPTEVLPDGGVLAGALNNAGTSIYNLATNCWCPGPSKFKPNPQAGVSDQIDQQSSEESWVKLPDGSILSYDIFRSEATGTFHAERFVPSSNSTPPQWLDASALNLATTQTIPGILSDPPLASAPQQGPAEGSELGPAFLLPQNGKVIYFGANGSTAIYTPSASGGSWSAGPAEPTVLLKRTGTYTQLAATDDPGAVLPNGDILLALSPLNPATNNSIFSQGKDSFLYEYNPLTQTFTDVTPGVTAAGGQQVGQGAFQLNMVVLPSGQVLMGDSAGPVQLYTEPTGAGPQNSWKPAISDITGSGTYTLTGMRLNGLDEGAAYGDDNESASNYPIIRLTDANGNFVSYAHTSHWSSTGVATGNMKETVNFTLPSSVSAGTYNVTVIANGIASAPYSHTFGVAPLSLTPTSVTADTVGTANNQSIVATGGAGGTTLSYSITSSTQPAALGVTFTVNGDELDITGTPTVAGAVTFSVTAHDSAGSTVSQNYTLTVNDVNVSNQLSITESGLVYNRATQLFGGTVTLTNTGTSTLVGTLKIVLTGLPPGVTLANASGTNADGTPYIYVTIPGGTLAPGQSLSIGVSFSNPNRVSFSYSVSVFDENALQ